MKKSLSAFILNPDILVFDEPTINLDSASKREFIELLKKLNHTKIIASHDLEMIKEVSDKIVVINNGRKIAEDSSQKIFGDKKLLIHTRLM